jgi:hypothetical protein
LDGIRKCEYANILGGIIGQVKDLSRFLLSLSSTNCIQDVSGCLKARAHGNLPEILGDEEVRVLLPRILGCKVDMWFDIICLVRHKECNLSIEWASLIVSGRSQIKVQGEQEWHIRKSRSL